MNTVLSDTPGVDTTVRLAATGDEVAFARLIAEHHASMARVAYVVCGDEDATKDALQSAWAMAWRRLGSLRDATRVRPWLIAIAANEARQVVRRRRRDKVVDISDDIDLAGGRDPIDAVEVVDLRRVLRGLRPEDRALLAMRFAAGLDSGEIAEQLGISPSGVRSRLARLLERLRQDLAIDTEEGR